MIKLRLAYIPPCFILIALLMGPTLAFGQVNATANVDEPSPQASNTTPPNTEANEGGEEGHLRIRVRLEPEQDGET